MKALLAGSTVAEALARPHNGFAILRLALALMVVVSHAVSVVTGRVEDEPLVHLTGFSLGEHAVNGFFAVSGFLVTMSFDRRGWRDYVVARSLRILPGLVAATLVVGLGLGAAMTHLPLAEYVASPDLWRFVRGTLLSFKSHASLPGVFETNPIRSPLGTVWTLKYETICYAAVLVIGLLGLLRRRWAVPLLAAGLALALAWIEATSPAMPKGVETALRLPLIFACGACLYLWRDRVRLGGWTCLGVVLAVLLQPYAPARTLLFLTESAAAIWLAFLPPLARPALDPKADLSYGVYLYGWPVQQSLHALLPAVSASALLAPAVLLTLIVAAASWYAVEKPALRLKARAMGRHTLGTIEPAGP
ncbi:acyltransferase family protein [Methylorubrum salsuginis]|uniref:Peptidoglycan/LPS O-acetylase OafA/YrhL, contains acyltransferase and SGNH-hydrolase domains n=1 Tax=Methylorubrum salsuginis TaxID=414703 RepID=A0A1I3Y5F8_9HYPH|nr:acyltransferase [Methylorubrum salsuginis]SFK27187.1 Peptidoglycan/LPS O-acetylase OafA/YrhL, contains acyltransferase and SGNH-hydrolase domains [Methylorubrum salsuginis]